MTTFPSHCKKQSDRQAPVLSVTDPDQGQSALARISSADVDGIYTNFKGMSLMDVPRKLDGQAHPKQINQPLDRWGSNLFQHGRHMILSNTCALFVNYKAFGRPAQAQHSYVCVYVVYFVCLRKTFNAEKGKFALVAQPHLKIEQAEYRQRLQQK